MGRLRSAYKKPIPILSFPLKGKGPANHALPTPATTELMCPTMAMFHQECTTTLPENLGQPLYGLDQAFLACRIGKPKKAPWLMVAEIEAGCGGDAGFLDEATGEGFAVVAEFRDVGVDIERALGFGGNFKAKLAQTR